MFSRKIDLLSQIDYLVSIQKWDSFRKVKEDVPLRAGLTTPYDLPDLRGRHEYIEPFRGLKSEPDAEIAENIHFWMGTS